MTSQSMTEASLILSQANGTLSLENEAHNLAAGTVLYQKADKSYGEYTGGSGQTASAVAASEGVIIARCAEVRKTALSKTTDAALAGLAAQQIIAR